MFVCLFGVYVPLSLIRRRHHYRLKAENFELCSFGHWAVRILRRATRTYFDSGHPFIMVITEDPWHLLPSVWQWSWNYLFLHVRLRSVTTGIRTPNLSNALTDCASDNNGRRTINTYVKKGKVLLILRAYRTEMCLHAIALYLYL